MQEGKPEESGKLMEEGLDWKPNAHKCQDRESNPGLSKLTKMSHLPHNKIKKLFYVVITLSGFCPLVDFQQRGGGRTRLP